MLLSSFSSSSYDIIIAKYSFRCHEATQPLKCSGSIRLGCPLTDFENNQWRYGAGDLTQEYLLKIRPILITENIMHKLSKLTIRNVKAKL